jgi:hypothetical protein
MADKYYCKCKECDFTYVHTSGGLKMGGVSTYFCFECLTLSNHFRKRIDFFAEEEEYIPEPPRYLSYFLVGTRRLRQDYLEKDPDFVAKTLKAIYDRYDPRDGEVFDPINAIESEYFDVVNEDYYEAVHQYNLEKAKPKVIKKKVEEKDSDPICNTCSNTNIFEMENKNCPLCGGKPEITGRAILD